MKENITKRVFTAFIVLFIILVLFQGLSLNYEDKKESPMFDYYLENHEETGAINLVEAILLDYRAYDTFGEVMVLFISIEGIIILGKEIFKEQGEKGGGGK